METKKSIGIWIRVSTEDQAKGESPEHHERRARLYAESKGWRVIEVYHMEAVSGKTVMEHPITKRMLSDIKSKKISGLIFSKLARLARNTRELLDFADIFKENNADLVSLQESIDTSSPAGRLFYTVIAAMAQWEREEISSRVAASVPIRASMGKPLGGQASFGYKWFEKELVIDENEGPIRKKLYEEFVKQKRKKATATILNNLGYRTRNGSMFSDTTVARLLRDSTAKGVRIANYTKSLGEGKNWELKPESDWVKITCPALVSEELWNNCNLILDMQEKKRMPSGPKPVYLLSGFLSCECGKKMYVTSKSPVFKCHKCRVSITADDIDEIYHGELKSFFLTDSDVNSYVLKSNSMIEEREELLKVSTNELSGLRKKADDLVAMKLNGEIVGSHFKHYFQPLTERITQLEDQLPELQAEIDILKIQSLSSETVLDDAKNLYENWAAMSFEEKRNVVEVITSEIIVGKEDISINLSSLPFLNEKKSQRNFRDSYSPIA
jgi:site-specific DNA recombinase